MDIYKRTIGIVFICLISSLHLAGCIPLDSSSSKGTTELSGDRANSAPAPDVREMRRQAVASEIRRWAVVIGISDYKYDNQRDPKGVPDLLYANRDAIAFANFLRSPSGGAFSPDHVRLLTDGQATVKEVKKAIGVFLGKSLEQDLVIIYFSGHGAPDPTNPKNLYLICHDTEPDNYYGTALPMWEIDVALKETIPSKKVFALRNLDILILESEVRLRSSINSCRKQIE